MYLALLSEKEKEIFLNVAFNLVTADGDYSDEEKAVIAGYCQEMQYTYTFDKKRTVKSIDVLINDIRSNSDNKIKKIFVFELIGLAMADGNYDESERNLINKLEMEFDIDLGFARDCETVLNEYIAFQTKLNQLILE